ncbi:MAG: glycerophosphodiester phosphodiesterase [Bacteroidales bacterium]|nr:glycerophosphodiester phosphodiesterase [Bacteroidales bacterium]
MNRSGKIIMTMIAGLLLLPFSADAQRQSGIVAHRGFWNCDEAGYAKNSVAALRCAQEAGFWGSEFDVNMTSDGVLIVYHDSDVEGKKIEKYPYAEFKDFKIKNGETIPTIDQYLEQGKKYPETMLVYELKPHSCDEVEDRFVELTIAKLKEHGLLDPQRVMFISFSLHMCEILAKELPDFTVQFLGSSKSPDELAERGINGVDFNHAVYKIHRKWYRQARSHGMSVNAWTVNKEKDMAKMFRMGVDQLTTDNPLEARELMKKMKIKEL